MADRPILFSAPMVLALLDGRKTQTRRILKPQPFIDEKGNFCTPDRNGKHWNWGQHVDGRPCVRNYIEERLRFAKGDRLYVREHWRTESKAYDDLAPSEMDADYPVIYEADADWSDNKTVGRFRQGMHMPRWASRLTLTVTDVRVERLQEISENDAEAEGVPRNHGMKWPDGDPGFMNDVCRRNYCRLWRDINGAGAWAANPWVVAVTFAVERRNIDQ